MPNNWLNLCFSNYNPQIREKTTYVNCYKMKYRCNKAYMFFFVMKYFSWS